MPPSDVADANRDAFALVRAAAAGDEELRIVAANLTDPAHTAAVLASWLARQLENDGMDVLDALATVQRAAGL